MRFNRPRHTAYVLSGSTLVELLVALSLASIVFGFGTLIFLQVNGLEAPHRQVQQRLIARLHLQQVEYGGEPPLGLSLAGIRFEQELIPHPGGERLFWATVRCYSSSGRLLFTRQKIIVRDES